MNTFETEVVFGAGTANAIGTGTANLDVNLDPVDLSERAWLQFEIECEVANTDAGDELIVRLQDRTNAGVWSDRIRSATFTGNMSPSGSSPEVRRYVIQSEVSLSGAEEAREPSGSAGGTALAAEGVIHGPFPPRFRNPGVGTETAWRVRFEQTNASTADAAFAGYVRVTAGGKC